MELTYPEILFATCEESDDSDIDNFIINTVQKEDFIFKTYDAKPLSKLIEYMQFGLKNRSVYVVALQDYKNPENSNEFLELKKGDLITLGDGYTGAKILSTETTWAVGQCKGATGQFPTEVVYVLPCLMPPTSEILMLFKVSKIKFN